MGAGGGWSWGSLCSRKGEMSDVLLLPCLGLSSLPVAGSLILQGLTHSQPCKKSLVHLTQSFAVTPPSPHQEGKCGTCVLFGVISQMFEPGDWTLKTPAFPSPPMPQFLAASSYHC